MALVIATWYWGKKYKPVYVNKLMDGVQRHLVQPHRRVVISENARVRGDNFESWAIPEADLPLLAAPGCVVRMRMFDPTWLMMHNVVAGDRVVNLDIDMIITRQLDPLFNRPEDFCILQHINTTNPCPFNGSVWMLRAGARPDVWKDFSLEANSKVKFHAFPDDQGWMWHKFPNGAAWTVEDGVYGFKKRGWPSGDELPANARIVAFPGHRDPSKLGHLEWVARNWVH